MKKTAFVITLFTLPILLSGCIIFSSNKTQSVPRECSTSPQTNATIAEIDAAGKLISESAKTNVYKAIARRPDLSPQERIHLTNAVTKHLISESAKEEILLILVSNRPPAPKQKAAVHDETLPKEGKEKPCTEKD